MFLTNAPNAHPGGFSRNIEILCSRARAKQEMLCHNAKTGKKEQITSGVSVQGPEAL
jgi:hypothetical protein